MAGGARITGRIRLSPTSVLTILDESAQKAERTAVNLTRGAIRDQAPVGPGRRGFHLRDKYRGSVRRTPFGYTGQIRRDAEAWYGRVVNNGREPGFSRGRHYPGARANPFEDRTAAIVEPLVERVLEQGGLEAGERIAAEALL